MSDTAQASANSERPDLRPLKIPRHVAIIMDGNGRWAKTRGLHRTLGHAKGASMVKDIIREANHIGIEVLTLYCFSTENWNRPVQEVSVLMDLLHDYLQQEQQELSIQNVRFQVLGQVERLPANVREVVSDTIRLTAGNTGLKLNFCLSYGGRAELVRAMQSLAREVQTGALELAQIDEQAITDRLYTAGLPDPDLVIRTSGENRISNFLLWQVAYAEFYITDTNWPDFSPSHFRAAIEAYSQRKRRFGYTDESLREISQK